MKTFEMRLEDTPFSATEKNKKTIEVRLNDERRKGIGPGDSIRFIRISDNRPMTRKVVTTRIYKSLKELIEKENFEATGGIYNDTDHWFQEINRYYSQDQQEEHGLLVIELTE